MKVLQAVQYFSILVQIHPMNGVIKENHKKITRMVMKIITVHAFVTLGSVKSSLFYFLINVSTTTILTEVMLNCFLFIYLLRLPIETGNSCFLLYLFFYSTHDIRYFGINAFYVSILFVLFDSIQLGV